jgi:DNA polymerase II large subunit
MQAVGLHPLTLRILKGYLTTGTQLKLDYPGKGGIVSPVDSIEPPIVMLDDGSVMKIRSEEDLRKVEDRVAKILFLGDILISIGDLIENNVEVKRPGYCEEWWAEELRERLDAAPPRLREIASWILEDPLHRKPGAEDAIMLSIILKIPLHPEYLPFWGNASIGDLEALRGWIKSSASDLLIGDGYASLPRDEAAEQALTKILVEHVVSENHLRIPLPWFKVLLACLRPFSDGRLEGDDPIQAVEALSGIPQRDKAGSFIGARMGRPEKAAQREMSPPVNVLFPIADAGGSMRDLIAAAKNGRKVSVELSARKCPECGETTWKERCPRCNALTEITGTCVNCGLEVGYGEDAECPRCGGRVKFSRKFMINVGEELYYSLKSISEQAPSRLKGVKGLNSAARVPELLEKGILRAKHGLYIYKDGTIRFDATNAPLTHFTPRQISTPIEKLRELGYTRDIYGRELASPDQILELKQQDVVIPRKAAEHLLKVSRFIDELLVKLAGMEPFYGFESIEDVVGALIAALSPHTYAGVVGRVIGFTDSLACFAHPVFHAAKRRDCDGDEDSIMLLLDPLINFSRLYLPGKIGGKMDAPLLLTVIIDPKEVDEQAHNLDALSRIPLEFYRLAERGGHISGLADKIPSIKMLLAEGKPLRVGFTHPQSSLTAHPVESSYKRHGSMLEKIMGQLELAEKVEAVDERMVVEKMVETHLLSDILGNMRAFLLQEFKCKRCGEKYRRPPLTGVCVNCGGEISQTVFRGAVEKYVDLVENLLMRKIRDRYLAERVALAIENVRKIFGAENRMGQPSLEDFLS